MHLPPCPVDASGCTHFRACNSLQCSSRPIAQPAPTKVRLAGLCPRDNSFAREVARIPDTLRCPSARSLRPALTPQRLLRTPAAGTEPLRFGYPLEPPPLPAPLLNQPATLFKP